MTNVKEKLPLSRNGVGEFLFSLVFSPTLHSFVSFVKFVNQTKKNSLLYLICGQKFQYLLTLLCKIQKS